MRRRISQDALEPSKSTSIGLDFQKSGSVTLYHLYSMPGPRILLTEVSLTYAESDVEVTMLIINDNHSHPSNSICGWGWDRNLSHGKGYYLFERDLSRKLTASSDDSRRVWEGAVIKCTQGTWKCQGMIEYLRASKSESPFPLLGLEEP